MSEMQEPVLEQTKEEVAKEKQRAAQKRYDNSDKGRATKKIYSSSSIRREFDRRHWVNYSKSEKGKTRSKRYYEKHRDQILAAAKIRHKLRYEKTKSIQQERCKLYHRKNRKTVIEAYGGICKCCGERQLQFLSIDHIENGRGNPAPRNKHGGGSIFYAQLRKMKFPPGFQVLCYNCNMAKGFYGVCPHLIT